MAPNRCSECAKPISCRDTECPRCGAPTNSPPSAGSESPLEGATLEDANGGEVSKGERRDWTHQGPFGFLRRHWNGEYSLARSYWINTFLITLFAPGLGLLLSPLLSDRPARFSAAAALLVTALGYASWVWAVRGTWVSATKQTAAGRGWGTVAKVMIVLGAFRIVGQLGNQGSALREQWATLLGKQAGPPYRIRLSRDGESIKVTGGMNDGAADALAAALDRAPGVKTVILDSPGGWRREGRLVAAVISQRGLATHVDGHCSSACTLAFLAGKERTLGPQGRLGFHQVRSIGRSDLGRYLDIGKTRSMYESAGLPPDFVEKVVATPSEKMWYPTVAELRAARVITQSDEWNAARVNLTSQLRPELEANLKPAHVPESAFTALLDCEVTSYIQWLNTTDCSYLSDKATTTLEWDEGSKGLPRASRRDDAAAGDRSRVYEAQAPERVVHLRRHVRPDLRRNGRSATSQVADRAENGRLRGAPVRERVESHGMQADGRRSLDERGDVRDGVHPREPGDAGPANDGGPSRLQDSGARPTARLRSAGDSRPRVVSARRKTSSAGTVFTRPASTSSVRRAISPSQARGRRCVCLLDAAAARARGSAPLIC